MKKEKLKIKTKKQKEENATVSAPERKKVLPLAKQGKKNAPILVVLDPPKKESDWLNEEVLYGSALKVFIKAAENCGFGKSDFIFALPCPPIPEEIESSDKKITEFVEPYIEKFQELLIKVDPKLIMFTGKWAGRVVTGKPIQISKARGSFQQYQFPVVGKKTVLPMYSPRHVLARPEVAEIFSTDFMMVEKLRDLDWKADRIAKIGAEKKNYRWCTDLSDLLKNPPKAMAVDTETTGLKWFSCGTDDPDAVKILTVQICVAPGDVRVCPVDTKYYPALKNSQRKKLVSQLKILLENKKIKKTGHNIKYDTHVLRGDLGININFDTDTQLLAFLIDENMQEKSLDECIRRWVPEMAGYNDKHNQNLDKSDMRKVSHDDMLSYGAGDGDASYRLAETLTAIAKIDKRQWNCYKRIIFPAIKAFADPVEKYGVKIDSKKLANLQKELEVKEKEIYDDLIRMVPRSIRQKYADPKKPKGGLSFTRDQFTRDILFTHKDGLRLKPKVFTKSTAKLKDEKERVPSVSTKQHLPYFMDEPFVVLLMEYVKLQKLRSTYVGVPFDEDKGGPTGFWQYIYKGKIHPSFILHRTVTGRAASANPNGQNFPNRGPLAKAYREIFVARKGYVFIETDLSQAELRIAAWMANEETMLKIYRQGGDIHAMTAAHIMGLSLKAFMALEKDIIKKKRQEAKAVNFGFLYGMWWKKFKVYAKTDYGLDFTDEEAARLRETFFELYPGLLAWHEKMIAEVTKNRKVRALHGAVRHLPSINSDEEYIVKECGRQAINSPVQRFASDIGLMAMARMVRDCDPKIMRPVLFVHDSLVVEVKEEYAEKALPWVKFYMESAPLTEWFGITPPLPIVADLKKGYNLGQMEEISGVQAKAPPFYDYRKDMV